MTQDPLDWLLGLELLGMKFGLANMRRLTDALGHPEEHFTTIHVAGTNGKGSVTAMVETALRAAGHRSARYTSPHLERLEERFVISGREVETTTLRDAVSAVREAVHALQQRGEFRPTFFECATAAAFELFRRERVQIAAIETGLGGRLDATNVVDPSVTAITSIDFDHEALLGNTISAIAEEKGGIIKQGVPVVIGALPPEAEAVIVRTAESKQAPVVRSLPLPEQWRLVKPRLQGAFQRDNAAVAIRVLETLRRTGLALSDQAIRSGIEDVIWPGRLEHLEHAGTSFLVDAAHNPAGARALASYIREIGWTDATLVFGAMGDKNTAGMLGHLLEALGSVVCTTAPTARAESADRLAEIACGLGARDVRVERDPRHAVAMARRLSRRVVIAGSIFLIGPLRGILR